MSDPIEAAEQRRQQIADAIERLEAAANAWLAEMRSEDLAISASVIDSLIQAIDDLARLRGEA